MKKVLSFLVIMLVSAAFAFSQEQAMVAHFFSKTPVVASDKSKGICKFGLTATPAQMDAVSKIAADYPQKYKFSNEAVTGKPYNYSCTIEFLQDTGVPYLHKTFVLFGIASFNFEGVNYPLDKMMDILK
jgi:hypothetical protein